MLISLGALSPINSAYILLFVVPLLVAIRKSEFSDVCVSLSSYVIKARVFLSLIASKKSFVRLSKTTFLSPLLSLTSSGNFSYSL